MIVDECFFLLLCLLSNVLFGFWIFKDITERRVVVHIIIEFQYMNAPQKAKKVYFIRKDLRLLLLSVIWLFHRGVAFFRLVHFVSLYYMHVGCMCIFRLILSSWLTTYGVCCLFWLVSSSASLYIFGYLYNISLSLQVTTNQKIIVLVCWETTFTFGAQKQNI